MNELMVREFGSKEVRWSNDDKLNLVDVAKCLGITRVNNQGKEYVKWNNNKDRNNIYTLKYHTRFSVSFDTLTDD